MLLSIIVPSFNHARFLPRTLDTILSQDYRPLEVVVCDGASKDDTVAVLERYAARHPELRWLSEPDRGPADAVNKGLARMRGDVVAIQSSDDIYYPGAFSAAMRVFQDDPQCGFIVGNYRGIGPDEQPIYTSRLPEFSWEAYFGIALRIPQSSIFFRAEVARAAGGWNPRYFGCDLDYWLRLLLRTRARRLEGVLSGWRFHDNQRTFGSHNRQIWEGYWQMIDDCKELATAPPRVRRLARASRHIMALYHHPTGNPWAVRGHALLGLLGHPTYWRYQNPRALLRLVPGYGWVGRLYRWLKGPRAPQARAEGAP